MNEQQGIALKTCRRCGKELTISNFYVNKKSKDGYGSYCKTCNNELSKLSHRKVRTGAKGLSGVYKGNPELAHTSTKTLLAELKARNYHGTLTFEQTITL